MLVGGVNAATNGLNARYYAPSIYANDQWNDTGTPTATQIDPNINFNWQPSGTDPRPAGIGSGDFSADWNGYIDIPTDGNYTFATTSDDGSIVYIDNNVVVNNGGAHPPTSVAGDPVALTKGLHPITVKYWECCDDQSLITLSWTIPGGSQAIVPPSALFPTPVTTPPTVHITANPATHDINVSTNFTFTANPVGSWGNNISYSWSIGYEKCVTAGLVLPGQSIPQYLDVACGNATISVTADDEKNNTAHDTYLVTVHENATPIPPSVSTFNISGFKISNATGSGIPSWNITFMNSTMQKSMLTVADGSYMFTNLVNGTYNRLVAK